MLSNNNSFGLNSINKYRIENLSNMNYLLEYRKLLSLSNTCHRTDWNN